jgi:uncharacterized protein (TIGR00375 family)
VGTGDFSHPRWLRELKRSLVTVFDSALYMLRNRPHLQVRFMLTNEVCTISEFQCKTKRIHHVLFTPSFNTADQINDRLQAFGQLDVDGRPTLRVSPPELVEEVMAVSKENVVMPAHIWTPWFSLFGSKSGFDRIEDCYQDMTHHIFAVETGLSSDPSMNWRLSALDQYSLISNSDAHSPYPYRIGREANIFELDELTYRRIVRAIRKKDSSSFKCTIETNPAYGKYHWTGHRKCNVSMAPQESKAIGSLCPVCGRPMTKGVDERVNDLADRRQGIKPEGAIDYVHLLPLHEVIGTAIGVNSMTSSYVRQLFDSLITLFGNEYSVMLDAPITSLNRMVAPQIATAISRVRNDEITVQPGYDGVYGKIQVNNR